MTLRRCCHSRMKSLFHEATTRFAPSTSKGLADQIGYTLDVNRNVLNPRRVRFYGAGYGIRTRVNQLGRLTRYRK
jgi:hypothetical protein